MTDLPDLRDDDWSFLGRLSSEPDGTGYVFVTEDRDDVLAVGLIQALPTSRFDPYGTRVEITATGREALALRSAAAIPTTEVLDAEEVETEFDFEAMLGRRVAAATTGTIIDLCPIDLDTAA